MLRSASVWSAETRRGVILVVVLALLTLFAIVGIGFVLYANANATSARLYRDAEAQSRVDLDPELLLSYFLGQLIFDVPDDARGVYSGLRGHSLARSMFGLNYDLAPDGTLLLKGNDVPFNGTGRLKYTSPYPQQDDSSLINYTYFPQDNFLRDPERLGYRKQLRVKAKKDNRKAFVGGFNAPYSYPDLNNMFLAAIKAGPIDLPDGTQSPPGVVLMPSFHRPWLFGPLTDIPGSADQAKLVNPNWIKPEGKYLLLRPRPVDMGPGFPYPEDEGGDVKNLVGGPGYYDPVTQRLHNNDSVWLDLDFPVMTAPDGRKFKPLFAPLVMDLDNRVNLNVAGNLRGPKQMHHASNSGWGPWEVNPERILDHDSVECGALLHGNGTTPGRYGATFWPHSPLSGNLAPWSKSGPFYAPIDLDGSNELAGGKPTAAIALQDSPLAKPYQCFPTFGAGYGNASDAERRNHPLLFNPFNPTAPDRVFALSNMEALLRYGDTGSPALTSDLFRLCPGNFGDPLDPVSAGRRRGSVTLASFDPDLPGISPWFWNSGLDAYERIMLKAVQPSGGPVPFPPLGGEAPYDPDSEFDEYWRTKPALTALRRLDLNRYLPDYPPPGPLGVITDKQAFQVAQKARQYFAAEIFERLWRAAGIGDPATLQPPIPVVGPNAERWAALRCLAQLAVNIVDYIDNDDYMTPFNWDAAYYSKDQGNEWVFGTELPRLVINEAYVQYDNDPSDPGIKPNKKDSKATWYNGNVWVELYNPMSSQPTLSDGGAAVLQNSKHPVYLLVVSRDEPNLRNPTNVAGTPRNAIKTVANWGPDLTKHKVLPSDGIYSTPIGGNQGFYVLGPATEYRENADPNLPATLLTTDMTFQVLPGQQLLSPTVLLRRLACPHLPPNDAPNDSLYNPYVTVDYMEKVPLNDGRSFSFDGRVFPMPMPSRFSVGRPQPYAGYLTVRTNQRPLPGRFNVPRHTFFQHNADINTPDPNLGTPPSNYPPFDWLVHLDRPLISPMELLHVSAFKPHELTHQFRTGDQPGQAFNHRASWFDEDLAGAELTRSHRLYRALEFLSTRNQTLRLMTGSTKSLLEIAKEGSDQIVVPRAMSGQTASGGFWRIEVGDSLVIDKGLASEEVVRVKTVVPKAARPHFTADFLRKHAPGFTIAPTTISERLPGKINLNTVWDEEVFQALCDAQLSNSFSFANVSDAFHRLKTSRTPGFKGSMETPGDRDRPFRSLATGFTPYDDTQLAGGGLPDTLLRSFSGSSDTQPLLAVPGMTHPYQSYQLLTKIFNNVTVRSNVFAVWVTVGFFEVIDDTTRPVKLGAEIGRAESRQLRHRMFAIVDRSRLLANPGPQPAFSPRAQLSPNVATGTVVPYFSIID
jgi:hypothetical protein